MAVSTGAIAEVNLRALCDNYRLLAAKTAPNPCAAVVKANAYGLGAERVSLALQGAGCRHFFVAAIAEGVALRAVLPHAEIGVFYGVATDEDVQLAIAHRLIPSLNSLEQVARWQQAAASHGTSLPAALHVDTGMSRLGMSLDDLRMLAAAPKKIKGLDVRWLMSHLACASTHDHPLNVKQLARFEQAQALFPQLPASFANSSGVFLGARYHGELARPGAALYGINPTPHLPNPMQVVVTLKALVLQIRTTTAPETVGYGATYAVPEGARLATVACGYADGMIRSMSNRAQAYAGGALVPVAGIVSMDVTVLDVSCLPENALHVGDNVEFVGKHLPVDDVAEQAGTIGYELFTSLGGRVQIHYIEE